MQLRENYPLEGPVDLVLHRRPSIKLRQNPTIVVCVPVGGKDAQRVFETPDGTKYQGQAFIAPAMVPIRWALNHMQIVIPLNTSASYLVRWGLRSAQARQHMTVEALKMEPDYILYWDDDVIVPPLALYTLYNFMQQHPEAGLVSGVYCTRSTPTEPLIFKRHGEGAYWGFQAGANAEPEEIFGAGAGFMLARASAVRKMIADNPDVPIWADEHAVRLPDETVTENEGSGRIMWGHDVRFCKLMYESGYKVFVDGRVLCGHWDIETGRMFTLPDDSEPVRRGNDVNKADYWDTVYTQEGANTWRRYPEMFQKVVESVPVGAHVLEVGAGCGILGSMLTAQLQVRYSGVDISQVAVDAARTRFLSCRVCAVKDLTAADLDDQDVIVATELVEHLIPEDARHLLNLVRDSEVQRFIFTVPNNCMPPEEVPEHNRTFTADSVREMVQQDVGDAWKVEVEKADAVHLIVVVTRQSAMMPEPAEVLSGNVLG